MKNFYTYLWLREDGTPYYAGKGTGRRAYRRRCPADPENILIQEWPDEAGALEGEKLLIAIYGRKDNGTGILRNLTDGGDGVSGLKQSEHCKRRVSETQRGRKASEETRAIWHRQRLGNKHRQGKSPWNKSKSWSEETRKKMSAAASKRWENMSPEESQRYKDVGREKANLRWNQRGKLNCPTPGDRGVRENLSGSFSCACVRRLQPGTGFNHCE
jgi:hypothetical protein